MANQPKQGTLSINNLTGGWINDFAKGNASSKQTKAHTYYSGLANFSRPNFLGQIASPFGENPNKAGTAELGVNAVRLSNNIGYFILRNGSISFIDLTVAFPPAINTYSAPAGVTTDAYKDIWNHITVAGLEALFYTYQTVSNAYIAYLPPSSIGSRNDTYFTLTYLNVPHVGCVSVANQSYITDGNYLQSYNPNAASPFATRINVGTGWTLCSVADYGNYVAVVGNNGNTSRMWLWNGTAQDPNFQYEIRDTNVTAIVNEGGQLRVFCYGKNGTTKIKTFDGSGFSEEADWETPTSLCASPTHGMVDVWLNQIVWRTPDGYVWVYGSPRKNELDSGANRCGFMTTDTTTQGCVKNLYQNNLYLAIQNGGSYYIYNVKADASYASTIMGNIKTALYELPHGATINMIRVYLSNYTVSGSSFSGSSLSMSLYGSYDSSTDLLANSIPVTDTLAGQPYYYYPAKVSIANLDSFYMNLNFYNCIIREIDIEYSWYDKTI